MNLENIRTIFNCRVCIVLGYLLSMYYKKLGRVKNFDEIHNNALLIEISFFFSFCVKDHYVSRLLHSKRGLKCDFRVI